jgi:hypothetical protein
MNSKLAILVLSCDKYSDLWSDFFKIRDNYWPDSDFDWYLITESAPFKYNDVKVIHAGKTLNWTGRLKYALERIPSKYIGWFLDDFYISSQVDNNLIHQLVNKMEDEKIDHINVSDVFDSLIKMPEPHYYHDKNLLIIPPNKKYGISTASALWNKEYLLNLLGNEDKNAWQFEIDLCKLAMSKDGLPGLILCDERKPFNVTPIPVVIQGKYYPKSIKYFKDKGISLSTNSRAMMTTKEVLVYEMNTYIRTILRSHPRISNSIKWIAQNIFGVKFFS